MNRSRTLSVLSFALSAGLTLIAVLLRTVAFYTHFDQEVGYFDAALLPVICSILCYPAVLLPAVVCLLIPKDTLPMRISGGRRDLCATLPLAGLLVTLFLLLTNQDMTIERFGVPILLTHLWSIAYMVAVLFGSKRKNLVTLCGFFVVLWGILVVGQTYLDPFVTMNSPLKLSVQFGCLGMMAGMCSELRFHMSRPAPRIYLATHCIAMFFCLFASLPLLIARLGGMPAPALYTVWGIVLLGYGLYFAARLMQYLFFPEPIAQAVSSDEAPEHPNTQEDTEDTEDTTDTAPDDDIRNDQDISADDDADR